MFIIAGNWKMNGDRKFAEAFSQKLGSFLTKNTLDEEIIIFPPSILLSFVRKNGFKTGGQDCWHREYGPCTGEISPFMLKDLGCEYVLLGHSERREFNKETSELVAGKAVCAHKAGVKTIICIGEKQGEDFETVVSEQIKKSIPMTSSEMNTIIAYEPVWAIGTGKTPTLAEIEQRQKFIKDKTKLSVLYGGSVKADNAVEIANTPNVDGLLVGGASLVFEEFEKIILAKA